MSATPLTVIWPAHVAGLPTWSLYAAPPIGVSTDISSSTFGSARDNRYNGTFCRFRSADWALPASVRAPIAKHSALRRILRESMKRLLGPTAAARGRRYGRPDRRSA